jgi:hypothetical protein
VLIVQGPVRRQSYPSGAGNREVIQEETAIEARLDGKKWITMSSVAHPASAGKPVSERWWAVSAYDERWATGLDVRPIEAGHFPHFAAAGKRWPLFRTIRGPSREFPASPHKSRASGGHRCACNHGENGLDRIVECAGLEFIRRQKSEDATGLTLSLSTGSLAALLSFVRFWPSCLYETKLNERQNEAQG